MENVKDIAAALAAAQASMGKALKQTSNPHLRSKYADLSSVMAACMPALNSAGIAVIQPTQEDETGRYVETVFIHTETGQSLSCRVPLIVQKNDMQGYGSAVTYARRYGLMAMAGIAPEDDDGQAATNAAPKQSQPQSQQAGSIADRLKAAASKSQTLDDLMKLWGHDKTNKALATLSDNEREAVENHFADCRDKLETAQTDLAKSVGY